MTCAPLKTSAAQKVVNIEDIDGGAQAGEELQEEAGAGRAVQRRRVGEAGDAAWDEVLRAKVEAQDALLQFNDALLQAKEDLLQAIAISKDEVAQAKDALLQSKDALLQAKDAEICRLQADIARLNGLIPPPDPRRRSLEEARQGKAHTGSTIHTATAAEKRE
jgi:hypothetical protein